MKNTAIAAGEKPSGPPLYVASQAWKYRLKVTIRFSLPHFIFVFGKAVCDMYSGLFRFITICLKSFCTTNNKFYNWRSSVKGTFHRNYRP